MSEAHRTTETLRAVSARVRDVILDSVASKALTRQIPARTVIAFDPTHVWLVTRGTIQMEYVGRGIMTLGAGDIVGPWFGSVAPLSLVTKDSECELLGFEQNAIIESLRVEDGRVQLWGELTSSVASACFAEFAELKALNTPPVPRYRSFKAGDTILREGDDGLEVMLLTEGAAEVSVRGTKVGEIKKNEIFGALAALTGEARTASVVATEPSICMVFGKDEFRDFLRSNSTLMEKLFEDFARALSDLNDSVIKASSTKWHNLF